MTTKRPKAIATGKLRLGTLEIDCHVLDDGRRVLSQRGISRAIGIRGNTTFSEHFGRLSSKVEGLTVSASVEFTLRNGGVVLGRPATDLVAICVAYQDAFLAGALHHSQEEIAKSAMRIVRALAGVGIEALIDEATGIQRVREDDYLQNRLNVYLREKSIPWDCIFPESVTVALCKVYQIAYRGRAPRFLASVQAKIYKLVFGKEIYAAMKARNPTPHHGSNHHQLLQEQPRRLLADDLKTIEVLANQSRNSDEMWRRLNAHYRKEPLQLAWN